MKSDKKSQMPGDCMTCMEMYGSGAMTGMENIRVAVLQTLKVLIMGIIVCCVAARGAIVLTAYAQLSASGSTQPTGSSTAGFVAPGLHNVFYPLPFYTFARLILNSKGLEMTNKRDCGLTKGNGAVRNLNYTPELY